MSLDKIQKFFDLEEDNDQRSVDQTALKRLIQVIFIEKQLLFLGLFLLIITTFTAVYEPRFLGQMIDEAVLPKDKDMILKFALGFFVLQLIRVFTLTAHSYLFAKLGQNVMQRLRLELFDKMQKLPSHTFSRVPVGKLVTRVTNDVSSLSDMFTAGFVTILGNLLYTLGTVFWLLYLDITLGLLAIAVLPVLLWLSIDFSTRLKIAYRTARARLSAVNAFLAENIMGMRVIQLFNRQRPHLDKFHELNNQYAVAQFGSVRIFALFQPSITMATGISMALVIWFGADKALTGQITLGFLASYFAYVLSLFQPVREIADKWNIFLAGMASVERIFSILDWDPESDLKNLESEALGYTHLKGEIEFRNVWFAYEGEKWVLKNFSLKISPGQKVGIVGPTGSGKTTLINLLLRFYDAQKGEVLLDGQPIQSYDKRRLRATVGLIQQDVFLFSGSLSENMSLWRRFKPEVREKLKQIETFRKFESQGLENEDLLQERGTNLSLGERQVMAFARALHTEPRLWILDEATANVDSDSERELETLLRSTASGRTLIVIAHRLASVRDADQIVVLQNGALTEIGDHTTLMSKDGLYNKLYRFQELE